jgi:hypothetical protein
MSDSKECKEAIAKVVALIPLLADQFTALTTLPSAIREEIPGRERAYYCAVNNIRLLGKQNGYSYVLATEAERALNEARDNTDLPKATDDAEAATIKLQSLMAELRKAVGGVK